MDCMPVLRRNPAAAPGAAVSAFRIELSTKAGPWADRRRLGGHRRQVGPGAGHVDNAYEAVVRGPVPMTDGDRSGALLEGCNGGITHQVR